MGDGKGRAGDSGRRATPGYRVTQPWRCGAKQIQVRAPTRVLQVLDVLGVWSPALPPPARTGFGVSCTVGTLWGETRWSGPPRRPQAPAASRRGSRLRTYLATPASVSGRPQAPDGHKLGGDAAQPASPRSGRVYCDGGSASDGSESSLCSRVGALTGTRMRPFRLQPPGPVVTSRPRGPASATTASPGGTPLSGAPPTCQMGPSRRMSRAPSVSLPCW